MKNMVNEASWERILRVVVGAGLLWMGWGGAVSGGLAWIFKVVGFIPLLTGLVGFCPAYALLNIRTIKK